MRKIQSDVSNAKPINANHAFQLTSKMWSKYWNQIIYNNTNSTLNKYMFLSIMVFIMFCNKQFLWKCLKNLKSLHRKKYDAEQSGLNLRKEKGDLKLKKIVFYSQIQIFFNKWLEINKPSTNRLNSIIIVTMCTFLATIFLSMILLNFYNVHHFFHTINPFQIYLFSNR